MTAVGSEAGGFLPATGGFATGIFTAVGAVLVGIGALAKRVARVNA